MTTIVAIEALRLSVREFFDNKPYSDEGLIAFLKKGEQQAIR